MEAKPVAAATRETTVEPATDRALAHRERVEEERQGAE
jgi:hypothetical protein